MYEDIVISNVFNVNKNKIYIYFLFNWDWRANHLHQSHAEASTNTMGEPMSNYLNLLTVLLTSTVCAFIGIWICKLEVNFALNFE